MYLREARPVDLAVRTPHRTIPPRCPPSAAAESHARHETSTDYLWVKEMYIWLCQEMVQRVCG